MSNTHEATKNQPELDLTYARDGLEVFNQQFKPDFVPTAVQLDGVNQFLDEVASSDPSGDLGGDEALQKNYDFARATANPAIWMLSQAETAKHEKVIEAITKGNASAKQGKLAKDREADVDALRDLYSTGDTRLSRRQGLRLYRDWLQSQVSLSNELKQRELAKPIREMHPKVRNEVLANLGAGEPKKVNKTDQKANKTTQKEKTEAEPAANENSRKPFRQMTKQERGEFFANLVKIHTEPAPKFADKLEASAQTEPAKNEEKQEKLRTSWRAKAKHLGEKALALVSVGLGQFKESKNGQSDGVNLGKGEEIAEYVYKNGSRHWYKVDENGNLLGQLKKADVEKYYDNQPDKSDDSNDKTKPEKSSQQKEEATKRRRKWAALGLVAVASLGLASWGVEATDHSPQTSTNQNNKPNPPQAQPYNVAPGQTLSPKPGASESQSVAQTVHDLKVKQAKQNSQPKSAELVVRAGDYPWDVLQRAGVPEGQIMSDLEQAGQAYEHATGNKVQWYGTGKHRWVKVNGQSDTRDVVQALDNYLQK